MSDTSSTPTAAPTAALSAMLCFDVYGTNLAFGRLYKPLLDPLGLTYPQFLVLITLWDQDDQSVGDIGRRLTLDTNTLTPMIKRLEGAGFLSRSRDPQDERRVRVTLTDRGRALQSQAAEVQSCMAEAIGFDPKEVQQLQAALSRLRAALQNGATA